MKIIYMVVLRKYNFFFKLNFDNSFLYILYEFDRKIFDQFSQKSHFGRATLSYFLLAEGLHFFIIVFYSILFLLSLSKHFKLH